MRLAEYLSLRKLTHEEFAELIGTSQPSVSRYASGERFPEPDIIQRIKAATKGAVTADDLLPVRRRGKAAA